MKPLIEPLLNRHRSMRPQSRPPRATAMAGAIISATILLSGCNQQSVNTPDNTEAQTPEQIRAAAEAPVPMSGSAKARIKQFEPIYVTQMQSLQRRLQAEYESLQAADTPASATPSLLTGPKALEATTDASANSETDGNAVDTTSISNDAAADDINTNAAATVEGTESNNAVTAGTETEIEEDINVSTEVGERDLQVLKRISLEPRQPEVLDEDSMVERYQNAMQALYTPAIEPLNAQNTDTLLTIATLIPQIFEHDEIAEQLSVKSPALARLIAQHQVWEQIEAQQAKNMQQMKLNQQEEFEALMTKFNDTIQDYDEQIAKYEQTLKAFEQ